MVEAPDAKASGARVPFWGMGPETSFIFAQV